MSSCVKKMFNLKIIFYVVILVKSYKLINGLVIKSDFKNISINNVTEPVPENIYYSVSTEEKTLQSNFQPTEVKIGEKSNRTAMTADEKNTLNGKLEILLKINIRLAIFLDTWDYKYDKPFNKLKNIQMRTMAKIFMNKVQELFHHSSLKNKIDLTIVHIELIEATPNIIHHYNGNADLVLDSFCDYQFYRPSKSWDIAIYLTGNDLKSFENDSVTDIIGLANLGSICSDIACAVVEFSNSDDNIFDFLFTYTIAHEIGHV